MPDDDMMDQAEELFRRFGNMPVRDVLGLFLAGNKGMKYPPNAMQFAYRLRTDGRFEVKGRTPEHITIWGLKG